jgi:hypothetical protein
VRPRGRRPATNDGAETLDRICRNRLFTTAREAGGTRLGLPLVRSSLDAAGGGIELVRHVPGAASRLNLLAA